MAANPKFVDIHVGSRVRLRRIMMGMSQQALGQAVNLTFQQIQKYERGTNRIGSSRLYEFSQVLDVPVAYFFEEIPAEGTGRGPGLVETGAAPYESDPLTKRETLELVRAYYRISQPAVRKRIFELVKAVARGGDHRPS